ncbi:MAG: RNA 2',3'-cyclic phosphodiesterase [Desulfuromonas sp.]|uniref:RNA 2',3'-cyclic phosphodiesterase n=1 Tax=Desulfuromonas sp. TaxID=892 RepID=UPI000CCB3394|nr:RNA 2',3'-cyclic phosphodiesterase [Desulfuromonas sp.]PLX86290.1 MAG: RNA 2',3'-cyclic phosphodiesterase [Desulfuromonas sp.]
MNRGDKRSPKGPETTAEQRRVRAFLAVPIPDEVLQATQRVRAELAGELPGVRWVRPEGIHLTLKFFGSIPEEELDKIGEIMLSVGTLHSPFRVRAAGLGTFPSPGRPRVIWVGIADGESLPALHRDLEEGLEQIGIPAEGRPFHPHLTLGRARERLPPIGEIIAAHRQLACCTIPVDELVLYESRLGSGGARYIPRKRFALGG